MPDNVIHFADYQRKKRKADPVTTFVIDFTEHQLLALMGAVLIGIGIGYAIAEWHITHRVNAQWFAERERVHQENKRVEEFIRLQAEQGE